MALRISTSLSVVLFSCFAAMPVQAQGALDAMIAAAQAEGALMVYHTSPMPIIESTFRAFEKKYGIKVQNYHATGNPLTVRFSSEAAAGQMIADVIYASDTTSYLRFPELFQQLTSEIIRATTACPMRRGSIRTWRSALRRRRFRCSTTRGGLREPMCR